MVFIVGLLCCIFIGKGFACQISLSSAQSENGNLTRYAGETLNLSWTVEKVKTFVLECTKNGQKISTGDDSIFSASRKIDKNVLARTTVYMQRRESGAIEYGISIADLNENDAGLYQCSVLCIRASTAQYVWAPARLTVQDVVAQNITTTPTTRPAAENNTTTTTTTETTTASSVGTPMEIIYIFLPLTLVFLLSLLFIICYFRKKTFKRKFETNNHYETPIERPSKIENIQRIEGKIENYQKIEAYTPQEYFRLKIDQALWSKHEYAYIKSLQRQPKKTKSPKPALAKTNKSPKDLISANENTCTQSVNKRPTNNNIMPTPPRKTRLESNDYTEPVEVKENVYESIHTKPV